jgi:hypothetical protein
MSKIEIDQTLVEFLKEVIESGDFDETEEVSPRYGFTVNGKFQSVRSTRNTNLVKQEAHHVFGYLFPNAEIKKLWSEID